MTRHATTVAEALRDAARRLSRAGIDSPALDARLLLAHATGLDQSALLRAPEATIDSEWFQSLVARRLSREPIALIVGHQGFWTLDLVVSAATLIPRADSETLIEAAIAMRPDRSRVRSILDLGTGTGCLLLAALTEFPGGWGLGVDRTSAAAALARQNAVGNGLASRAGVVVADWAAPLDARFDLVFSNPPYIESDAIAALMPEVARFEPRGALDGGADGLDAYRALLRALPAVLAEDGLAILELGAGQGSIVAGMAAAAGFKTSLRDDLAGIPRALLLEKGVGTTPSTH